MGKKQYFIKKNVFKTFQYGIVTLIALLILTPFCWLLINSFKTNAELLATPWALPTTFHFENYTSAWRVARIGRYLLNTTLICTVSLFITLITSSMAAFVITRMKIKFSNLILTFFLFGLMIPVHATLISLFISLRDLKLMNSYFSLILPYIAFGIPISVYIIAGFMRIIPNEMDESAIIDGCNMFKRFFYVILPLSRSALITVAIINFISFWNEYLMALCLVTNQDLRTLQVGLTYFSGEHSSNYTLTFAGIVISAIPTVVFYLIMQEQMIEGLTSGAVKG